MNVNCSRLLVLGAILIAVLGLPFSAGAEEKEREREKETYYLSLGDSLAAGFQPNVPPPGPWTHGYADQLFTALHAENPSLRLKKLGCYTDETTLTMMTFGACSSALYHGGSQLHEAVDFLQDHKHSVALITIDIGANDVLPCSFPTLDVGCLANALMGIKQNLPKILQALHKAAPDVPIVGKNYYDPLLAIYLIDQTFATATVPVFDQFNDTLERIYRAAGSPVANVEGVFSTTHFTPLVGSPFGPIPLNVERICQWTWECTPSSDIHPNQEGYHEITRAFLKVLP